MAWKYFWEIWNIWMCVCSPSSCLHSICFPAGGIALHIMHFSNQMEENLQNQKEWGISEHTFLSVPFWNISLQSFYNLFANCQKIAILSHIHIFIHSKVTSTIWYNTQTIIKTANLTSESWPRLNVVTSTKHQQQNTEQTSASKSWPKSRSEQKLSFMTKPQLLNLQQTVANTILITHPHHSNSLNKFWEGIFTRQGHINQVY